MVHTLRHLLLVLIAFALIGGTSSSFARSADAGPMRMAGMTCDAMMSHAGTHDDRPMPPCKGMNSACKQVGCVTNVAVPARIVSLDVAVRFSEVDYPLAGSTLADFVRKPEPLPPRTI